MCVCGGGGGGGGGGVRGGGGGGGGSRRGRILVSFLISFKWKVFGGSLEFRISL